MSRPFNVAFRYFSRLDLVSYVLLLLFSIQLAYGIWAIDRGFDFSDEAFGYLNIKNPEETRKSATFYAVVYNTFFGWIDVTIINLRIVRLGLLLSSGLFLGMGFANWARRSGLLDNTNSVNICLFILIGSLLVNGSGTQSLTYNLFSTFLLQIITGIFFLLYKREAPINRKDSILFFLLGALMFALLLVKFSNALLMTIPLLLFIVFDKRSIRKVAFYTGISLAGAIFMGILMFKNGLSDWLTNYMHTLQALGDKTGDSIWKRYQEDFQTVKSMISAHFAYVTIVIIMLICNKFIKNRVAKSIIAGAITIVFGYVAYKNDFYLGGTKYIYTITFLYILTIFTLFISELILLLYSAVKGQHPEGERFLIILFLLAIPFIGSLGTNNLLSVQFIWYPSFLFCSFYMLLYSHGRYIMGMLMLLLALNATLQSVSGLVYFPYRINENLLIQTNELSPGISKEKVMVDGRTKQTIENAGELLYKKTTFSPGDPIFSYRSDFGLIYFLNGSLPGVHWYREEDINANCEHIKSSKIANLKRTVFILPASYKMDSVFSSCLSDLHINFPTDYIELGEVANYTEGVERPLKIFAPYEILKK